MSLPRRNRFPVLDRRRFLFGAGGTLLALPFLEQFAARGARAQSATAATPRLVIMMHGEGTMNTPDDDRWTPAGTGANFELSPLLAGLSAYKSKLNVLSGIDNQVATIMGGNGHNKAGRSLLTCQTFSGGGENGNANGPSIDQVIAERIGSQSMYRSLPLQACGTGVGEYQLLFAAKDDPVGATADPNVAFNTLFSALPSGSNALPPPAPMLTLRDKLHAHRASVLDSVNQSFSQLMRRVGADDRARLQLHAEKIQELERLAKASTQAVQPASAQCGPPMLALPSGYDVNKSVNDQYTAAAQMKNAAMALACGLTRVATIQFTDYDSPTFPWTGADIPGAYSNWHAMIHRDGGVLAGRDDAVFTAMSWYTDMFRTLLDELSAFDEGGATLLDNTLVVWIAEFGDGGVHDTSKLPVVLAGGLGGALKTGQHLSFAGQGRTTNDMFVTLLNLFGGDDAEFGYGGSDYNKGALPGLSA